MYEFIYVHIQVKFWGCQFGELEIWYFEQIYTAKFELVNVETRKHPHWNKIGFV